MCTEKTLVPVPTHLQADYAEDWLFGGDYSEFGVNEGGERCFAIDRCIAPAVKAVWAAGIKTTGCCCGHGDGGGVVSIATERVDGIEPGSKTIHVRESLWRAKDEQIADLERQVAELTEQCGELNALFDLRWKADMRAVERWRAGHPERELRLPDHADMVVWLLEREDARDALIERLRERYWRADIACPACGRVVRGSVLEELGYCPRCLRADGQAKAPAADGQPRPDGGGGAAGC